MGIFHPQDVHGKNRITCLITFPANKGDGWDRPILCDEKVFQYGDAIEIHPGTQNAYYETNCIKGGDTAPIIKSAPNVVEVEAYCSRQLHLSIELDVAYVYTDEEGRVTIYSKSIGIHLHHAMIGEGIGVAPEKRRLVQLHRGNFSQGT